MKNHGYMVEEFALSVQVNVAYGNKSPIFLSKAASIMIKMQNSLMIFILWCRINFIPKLQKKELLMSI